MNKAIRDKALAWAGKEFKPGITEQCCNFVREVLLEAGYNPGVTEKPSDNYFPTSEGYANSLAGDDIGKKISRKDLEPGDLVFFKNTYGNYPEGTITHVGIYTGDGYFVHRPTSARPVEEVLLDNYCSGQCFAEGRRLKELEEEDKDKVFKLYLKDKKIADCIVIEGRAFVAVREFTEALGIKISKVDNKEKIIYL